MSELAKEIEQIILTGDIEDHERFQRQIDQLQKDVRQYVAEGKDDKFIGRYVAEYVAAMLGIER